MRHAPASHLHAELAAAGQFQHENDCPLRARPWPRVRSFGPFPVVFSNSMSALDFLLVLDRIDNGLKADIAFWKMRLRSARNQC